MTGGQLRLGLFAAVFALLLLNASGPWSDHTAQLLYTVMQSGAGVAALVCGIVGIDVITEGIESTAQADTVFAAGCRLAQGHLFGRTVPISDLATSLEVPSGLAHVRREDT